MPSYVSQINLEAWFPFDNGFNDISINNISGTQVLNPISTIDRFSQDNSAFEFDGNGSYFNYGDIDNFEGINDLSLSVWVQPYDFGGTSWSSSRPILSKWFSTTSPERCSWNFLFFNDSIRFSVSDGINTKSLKYKIPFDINEWHHIVCTFSNGNASLYINGENVTTQSLNINSINSTDESFSIGDWYSDENNNYSTFYGKIDDVGVWSRALTQCEITALYTTQDCNVGLLENINQPKKLVKQINLLGQDVENESNSILINIYSDGSTKKVVRLE